MTPAVVADESNGDKAIPLACPSCSTSGFSDLSHLLTHFMSKTHLLTTEQSRIRGLSSPEDNERYESLMKFHKDYNIDPLLANRLALKDQKEKEANRALPRYQGKPSDISVSSFFFNYQSLWSLMRARRSPRKRLLRAVACSKSKRMKTA